MRIPRGGFRRILAGTVAALAVIWILLRARVVEASSAGAILFLAATDNSLNAYSSITSSPQTTELFASDRADSLMKYVWLANLTTFGLSAIASLVAHSLWPLAGATLVIVLMHSLYRQACREGAGEQPPAAAR